MMRGEREQFGMKPDRLAHALKHGALQVVVQEHARHAGPCAKGAEVAAQEVLQPRAEEEAQVDRAGVAQDHHEGHQRTARAADRKTVEVRPVDRCLFAGQRAQPQVGLGRRPRAVQRHEMAEVIGCAAVAAFDHHGVQAGSGERGELLQRRENERQIWIDGAGPRRRTQGRGNPACRSTRATVP